MKHYLAALPGQNKQKPEPAPEGNIVDSEHYKLSVKLNEFRPNEWVLVISSWIPETNWVHKQYFMSPKELAKLKGALE